jgi:hypothetical protein
MPLGRRRGPGRPFKKGEGGRPKGRKDNRTLVREYIGLGKAEFLDLFNNGSEELNLKPRQERIAALLTRAPAAVAAALERELILHSFGRPKESLELSGSVELGEPRSNLGSLLAGVMGRKK